jgi:serine/threonine-protein kinase RsbW
MTSPARIESLYPSLDFVLSFADRCGIDGVSRRNLELSLEEVLVNIYHYAYPDHPGDVSIHCSRTKGDDSDFLAIEIADQGIPFDILSVPKSDISAGIENRPIGRLGIYFVRQLMDDVRYRHEKGQNIVTLKVSLKHPTAA